MTGKIAFEAWGSIDPQYILEAAPDGAPVAGAASGTAQKPPKGHRPLGGWVAAAVCVFVALGVYLGALWMGGDGPEPPAVTDDGTHMTEEAPDETEGETLPLDDGFVEPSPTFANQHYVVEEIDGRYYLNFYSGNVTYSGNVAVPAIEFSNMEDMFTCLYYGNLTDEQVEHMKNYYLASQGYPCLNLCDLAVPVSAEGHELGGVDYFGNAYSISCYAPALSQNVSMVFRNHNRSLGWAGELVTNAGTDADTRTEGVFANMPAMIATVNYKNIKRQTIYVFHYDATTDTEYYAEIKYEFAPTTVIDESFVYDMPPSQMKIVATRGTIEYSVSVIGFIPEDFVFTRDFLLSFAIEPFDTPRVAPSAAIEKEPYEIIEEDGAWYLTFPEWDGTLPDVVSSEEQTLALPTFASVEAMRDTLLGDDMSLYNQFLFKMNADENGRVRVPNLDALLSPSLSERHSKPLTFYLDGKGGYYGSVSYYDCTMTYSARFEMPDEESWLAKRESCFLREGEHGLTILQVVEGTFDGLPCTFYEYTYDPSSEEGEYVLCHIRVTEGSHEREYFLSFYGALYNLGIDQYETNVYPEYMDFYGSFENYIFGKIDGQYYRFYVAQIQKPTAEMLRDFTATPLSAQ